MVQDSFSRSPAEQTKGSKRPCGPGRAREGKETPGQRSDFVVVRGSVNEAVCLCSESTGDSANVFYMSHTFKVKRHLANIFLARVSVHSSAMKPKSMCRTHTSAAKRKNG